jgi:lysophospholipase L1-like esterase
VRLAPLTVVRRRAFALLAVVALVGCAAASGQSAAPATIDLGAGLGVVGHPGQVGTEGQVAANAADIDSVVMIGDSITKGSTPALLDRFDLLGLDTMIQAENGKRMAVSVEGNPSGATIAGFLESGSDDHANELWVVALGANDVGQYSSPDEIAAAVNEVLDGVPDESPLVWVDTYFRDRPEAQAVLNSIVHDRVTRRGNSVVAPWSSFATADVLVADGVHPTPEGTEVFAFVVTDTARAFLGL